MPANTVVVYSVAGRVNGSSSWRQQQIGSSQKVVINADGPKFCSRDHAGTMMALGIRTRHQSLHSALL